MDTQTAGSTKKAGLIGGLLGSAGIAASILLFSATAGAASPTLEAEPAPAPLPETVDEIPDGWEAAMECWGKAAVELGIDTDEGLDSFTDFDAFDAAAEKCDALLPQDVQDDFAADDAEYEAFDAEFTKYETCVDDAFDAAGISFESVEIEIDDATFDALETALAGCDELLPEGLDLDFEDAEFDEVEVN